LDDAENQHARQQEEASEIAAAWDALWIHLWPPWIYGRLCYCSEASTVLETVSRMDPMHPYASGTQKTSYKIFSPELR
jgi:hypothetical protein